MPDYTPNLNLYLPGGGGSGTIPDEIADIDKLNENFRLIDASLGGAIVPAVAGYTPDFDGNIVYARNERRLLVESAVDGGLLNIAPGANAHAGTAAEREAFKAFATDGTIWHDTDGNRGKYVKRGAEWGAIPALLSPTTLTHAGGSASQTASGRFEFAGVTSVTLDNIFTASYRDYQIIFDVELAATGGAHFKLRTAGTTLASNYSGSRQYQMDGTNASQVQGPDTFISLVPGFGRRQVGEVLIYNPTKNGVTHTSHLTYVASLPDGTTSSGSERGQMMQKGVYVVDGIMLETTGPALTGSFRVIGIP